MCKDGLYSSSCNFTCGHCLNGETCNKENGTCINGCQPNYQNPLCQGNVQKWLDGMIEDFKKYIKICCIYVPIPSFYVDDKLMQCIKNIIQLRE